MEGLLSSQAGIAMLAAMRAADAAANPASQEEVDNVLRWLKCATGGSAPLQQRVLDMMRLHEEVGMEQPLQPPFLKAGGVPALVSVIINGWPEGSNFAESPHESDEVVVLPVELDVALVGCGGCTGQRHLGIKGYAQPLHRSLRRAALCALSEMANYSIIVEAIHKDGRLFSPTWLPRRLQQVMTQCKYGLTYAESSAQREQVHVIAERLLYLCGNCCSQGAVVIMLNAHCSLSVIQAYRDEWQRKHEPRENDHHSSSSSKAPQPQRRLHRIPEFMRPGPMTDVAHKMSVKEAATDKMAYAFARYVTHCVQAATREQKVAWVQAGAVAKVRVVLALGGAEMLNSADLDVVLQQLLAAWHVYARQQAVQQARDQLQVKAAVEQQRLMGNAAYKQGQLPGALMQYRLAAMSDPSNPLLYNNISLVQLKMGNMTEAISAAISALQHGATNAKAWLRIAEAYKAAQRWQLAHLYYSFAIDELGVTDEGAKSSRSEVRSHLSRAWSWAEVPNTWQADQLAHWLGLPARRPNQPNTAAWANLVLQEFSRVGLYSSRAMAVTHKVAVSMVQAWRAAEAGQLRQLPSRRGWTLRWRQQDIRCITTGHVKYETRILPDPDPALVMWELITPVEGRPSARDMLMLTAMQCMYPIQGGPPEKPKQLLLAYRCKDMYAELHDVITTKWGIPLVLETELEALRVAKETGEHYLGLQPSVAAKLSSGASEQEAAEHLRLTWAPIMLPVGQEDTGCDHVGAPGSSVEPQAEAGASGSSQRQAVNGHAGAVPQQQQPAHGAYTGKSSAEVLRLEGNAAFKQGQLQTALQHYKAAVQLDPCDPLLYNNISLVMLKLGNITEAYTASIGALQHGATNAKAWLRVADACKAAGRWQLAHLLYSTAVDELGLDDDAVKASMLDARSRLARVWSWADVPAAWQLQQLAQWLGLRAKPGLQDGVTAYTAWVDWVLAEYQRLTFTTSRALAVQRKTYLLMARAWRAAEAGRLSKLPLIGYNWRLTWLQGNNRGLTSGHCKYTKIVDNHEQGRPDDELWLLNTVLEGQPCAHDLLLLVAMQCMYPVLGGAAEKPQQVVVAYRCKDLYSELQCVMQQQWGIPLLLETEHEALRAARKEGAHYLGLQPSIAAKLGSGVSDAQARQHLPLTMARILLDEGEEDVGCDHKGANSSKHDNHSSTRPAANNRAAGQQQQQPQPPVAAACVAASAGSSLPLQRSSGSGPGWSALLSAVRDGRPGASEINDLAAQLQQL